MTQYEERILLATLQMATEHYIKQKQLLREYIATNPRFPMVTKEYQESKAALLTLIQLCRSLGIRCADMVERMLEDEE